MSAGSAALIRVESDHRICVSRLQHSPLAATSKSPTRGQVKIPHVTAAG